MQKVRGHLHSDSTPSWPTDHVARKGREMRHRRSPVLHAAAPCGAELTGQVVGFFQPAARPPRKFYGGKPPEGGFFSAHSRA